MTKRGNTNVTKYNGAIPFSCGPPAYVLKITLAKFTMAGKWFKREQDAIVDHIFNPKRCASDVINTRRLAFRLTGCRGAHFVILSHS
jgi:hypothetical protein